MSRDDLDLISKLTAQRIDSRLRSSTNPVGYEYINFIKSQRNCRKDVAKIIETAVRSIILGTMFERTEEDEDILNEEHDTNAIYDPIGSAFNVVNKYSSVAAILQAIFAAGLLYGKGIYESDLEESMSCCDKQEQLGMDEMHNAMLKALSLMTGRKINLIDLGDIDQILQDEPDDEQEEDRGPDGEPGIW
jgi:hypothetical protein